MTPSASPSRTLAVVLTLLVAASPIGTDLYLSSLPDMARDFKTDTAMVQMTLASFVAGFALMQLAYGPLSDRFGRRRTLLGGMTLFLAASLFCVFAPSIQALIAGRFVQGMGACCGPVVSRAVVRDIYPRDQAAKVMSYMASAMALAPLVAPTIGGWFHDWFGWRSNFGLLALFGLSMLVLVWRMLDETNRHPDPTALNPGRMIENYAALIRDRAFIGHALTVTAVFAAVFVYLSSSSFVLIDHLRIEPRHFGLAFGLGAAGYIAGGFIAARITQRVGIERMIGIGVSGCAGAGLVMAALAWGGAAEPGPFGVAAVMGPVMVFFFFAAISLPNATATAISPFPTMAGSASAALGFIQMGGGAGIGWLVSRAFDGSARPMATAMAAMGLAACGLYFKLARPAAKP